LPAIKAIKILETPEQSYKKFETEFPKPINFYEPFILRACFSIAATHDAQVIPLI
jgi:hypothetical protein